MINFIKLVKKYACIAMFWIWIIAFSIYLALLDWLYVYIGSSHGSNFFYNNFYAFSYFFFPLILLCLQNSFFKKALISFLAGVWMWILMYMTDGLYKLPGFVKGYGNSEPFFAYADVFFSLFCFLISIIYFIVGIIITFVKLATKK